MPDSAFNLFIELAVELKKGKGGWFTKVVDAGKYQIFDHVRKPIQGSLLVKDGKKFIENSASKRYRIATHPYATIKALAKKLPNRKRALTE